VVLKNKLPVTIYVLCINIVWKVDEQQEFSAQDGGTVIIVTLN
jgi:hypothetical protein